MIVKFGRACRVQKPLIFQNFSKTVYAIHFHVQIKLFGQNWNEISGLDKEL